MPTTLARLMNVTANGRRSRRSAMTLVSGLLMIAPAGLAIAGTPLITAASVDTAKKTLVITGSNLLGADGAGIASVTLANISLVVVTQTKTSIIASFPAATPVSSLAPGSYPLTVKFFGSTQPNTATSSVTVGVQTRLLFSFVNTEQGFDTAIVISNISADPTTVSTPTAGACTLHFLGRGVGPVSTALFPEGGTVEAGTWEALQISVLKSNFHGYIIAVCPFKATGLALFSEGGFKSSPTAIPAIVNP